MLASEIFTCPGVLLHTCTIDHRSQGWAGCFRADTAALLISLPNEPLTTRPTVPLVSCQTWNVDMLNGYVFTETVCIAQSMKCKFTKINVCIIDLFQFTEYMFSIVRSVLLKQQSKAVQAKAHFLSHLHIRIVSLLSHCERTMLLKPTGNRWANFRSLFSSSNCFPWFLKGYQFSWIQAELKGALLPVRWGRTSAVAALSHASTTGPRPQADRGDTCSLREVGQHLKS